METACDLKCLVELQTAKKDRLPMVLCAPDEHSTERIFLDISTKQFHTINSPVFEDAYFLYSKEGWLLLCSARRLSAPFILFNPNTGSRFDLPRIDKRLNGPITFSTESGVPDRVIRVNNEECGISIYMICPGDEAWKVHVFKNCVPETFISAVTLVGMHVICIGLRGRLVIFNISEQSWLYFPQCGSHKGDKCGFEYIVEDEGEIVKICCPYPCFSSFNFSKLDFQKIDWVELDDVELENTSWFLGHPNSFRAKDQGRKVYTLNPNDFVSSDLPRKREFACRGRPDFKVEFLGCRECVMQAIDAATGRPIGPPKRNVYIHNLVDSSYESLVPDPFPAQTVQWVDLDIFG